MDAPSIDLSLQNFSDGCAIFGLSTLAQTTVGFCCWPSIGRSSPDPTLESTPVTTVDSTPLQNCLQTVLVSGL